MIEHIYFDYYKADECGPFGQIIIINKWGEKTSTINLNIKESEFKSIYLAFKECSKDERYLEYNSYDMGLADKQADELDNQIKDTYPDDDYFEMYVIDR